MEPLSCHPRAVVAAQYRDKQCTLDGKPARIVGWREPFAIVRAATGGDVQFAWANVANVMKSGGAFKS